VWQNHRLGSGARVALVARDLARAGVPADDEAGARVAALHARDLHLAATRSHAEKEEQRSHTSMSFHRLLTRENTSMPTSEQTPIAVKMYQMSYGWYVSQRSLFTALPS
jgi:hypothetical protein